MMTDAKVGLWMIHLRIINKIESKIELLCEVC